MGAKSSKQEGPLDPAVYLAQLQSDDSTLSRYSVEMLNQTPSTSAVAMQSRFDAPFPTELPERPSRSSRMSLRKKKKATTQAAQSSTHLNFLPSPPLSPISGCTNSTVFEPFAPTTFTPPRPSEITPPPSPLFNIPRRKPVNAGGAVNRPSLRPAASLPELSLPSVGPPHRPAPRRPRQSDRLPSISETRLGSADFSSRPPPRSSINPLLDEYIRPRSTSAEAATNTAIAHAAATQNPYSSHSFTTQRGGTADSSHMAGPSRRRRALRGISVAQKGTAQTDNFKQPHHDLPFPFPVHNTSGEGTETAQNPPPKVGPFQPCTAEDLDQVLPYSGPSRVGAQQPRGPFELQADSHFRQTLPSSGTSHETLARPPRPERGPFELQADDDLLQTLSNVPHKESDRTSRQQPSSRSQFNVSTPPTFVPFHQTIAELEAATHQENLDRQLAEQLQREEEEAMAMTIDDMGSGSNLATSGATTHHGLGSREEPFELDGGYRALAQPHASGSYDDPIILDSDDEEEGGVNLAMAARSLSTAVQVPSLEQYFDRLRNSTSHVKLENSTSRTRAQQEDLDEQTARRLQQEQEQEDALRRQVEVATTRDCAVCGDSVRIYDFPSLAMCEHLPQTCLECYQGWIESELETKGWNKLTCPEQQCAVVMQHHEVQMYATPGVYNRFDTLSARSAMNADPDFLWCRAPNCESGQYHISREEGPIFRCNACGFRVCVIHEDTWHEGETCEEYEYRKSGKKERDEQEAEEKSKKALEELSKKCPGKDCGWRIQKNKGCDHMTCSRCRHEFCWMCLAPYGPIRSHGNSRHEETCKYHTERLPAHPDQRA